MSLVSFADWYLPPAYRVATDRRSPHWTVTVAPTPSRFDVVPSIRITRKCPVDSRRGPGCGGRRPASFWQTATASMHPSLLRSPTPSPRPRCSGWNTAPAPAETSTSRPWGLIVSTWSGIIHGNRGRGSITWPLADRRSSRPSLSRVDQRDAKPEEAAGSARTGRSRRSGRRTSHRPRLLVKRGRFRRISNLSPPGHLGVAVEVAAGDAHAGLVTSLGACGGACDDPDPPRT